VKLNRARFVIAAPWKDFIFLLQLRNSQGGAFLPAGAMSSSRLGIHGSVDKGTFWLIRIVIPSCGILDADQK
jgi:hypothetical protein